MKRLIPITNHFYALQRVVEEQPSNLSAFERRYAVTDIKTESHAIALVRGCNALNDGFEYDYEERENGDFLLTRESVVPLEPVVISGKKKATKGK